MSGFEIAGIVLGAIPIVIEALSAYREGKGFLATIGKSRGLVDELIHKLKTQQTLFYFDIVQLLREARVPEILMEGDPTADECIEILQVINTGNEVEQYLGPRLFDNVLDILGFYEKYLKELTSKLGHIAAKDNLASIVRACRSSGASLAFKGKVKFAIDRESLNTLIQNLETESCSLRKLVLQAKTKREWEASEPTRSSTTLTLAFSRARESATSLYWAACKCWVCDQHPSHTFMIRLEHRISESKNQATGSSAVAFQLCFLIQDALLQRVEVRARRSDFSTTKTVMTFQNEQVSACPSSVAFGGGLKVPSVTVTETPDISHPTAARVCINSICEDARKAQKRRRVLSLELTSRTTLEAVENDDESPHSYDRSISLANFLKDTAVDYDTRMSPNEQTLLALNVVSSVLQLRQTMWYRVPWNSTTIKFLVQAVDSARAALRTPYVEQAIDPTMLGTQDSPDLTTEAAKTTMLEVAILLLEILHHKTIATWSAEHGDGDPGTYWERMRAATCWLGLSEGKLLPPHLKVVDECLMLCVRSKLSWDDNFQRSYCENIIKPLSELIL
ncbi:hypothetical protein MY5147_007999 [Beauveria neobassiana]